MVAENTLILVQHLAHHAHLVICVLTQLDFQLHVQLVSTKIKPQEQLAPFALLALAVLMLQRHLFHVSMVCIAKAV